MLPLATVLTTTVKNFQEAIMAITTQPRVPQIRQPNTKIMAGVFGAVVLALAVAGAAFAFAGSGADDTPSSRRPISSTT